MRDCLHDSCSSMALFNPLQIFIFPFVFLIGLPLALFAGLTTTFAFLVLFLRLFLVYIDVGLELVRHTIRGHKQQSNYLQSTPASRRNSIPFTTPSTTVPPSPKVASTLSKSGKRRMSGSATPLALSVGFSLDGTTVGIDRDYEGIGGWKLDSNTTGEPSDGQGWDILGPRIDLPDHQRHHYRSHSGNAALLTSGGILHASPGKVGLGLGLGSYGGVEDLRMTTGTSPKRLSPNHSRSRTPTRSRMETFTSLNQEGYFPPYNSTSGHMRRVRA